MSVVLDPFFDALGVIDVQPTFMPSGTLPTPDGDDVIEPVNRLLQAPFGFRFATQDWHPPHNVSFASSHPGRKPFDRIATDHGTLILWPDHAVQGSHEAELHSSLKSTLFDVILRKGAGQSLEGYSAFTDLGRQRRTGLASMLRERGIKRVFLTGLALDVCVAATAQDAALEGFSTVVVEDACRASDSTSLLNLRAGLTRLGVLFVRERDLTWPKPAMEP